MDKYALYIYLAFGSAAVILGLLSLTIALKHRALVKALKEEAHE